MGEVTDDHRMVFMFECVKKVNELTPNKDCFSSKCIVGDLDWSILIKKKTVEDEGEFEYVDSDLKDSLTVKINCGGKSKLWCSYARVRLSLISQKDGENYSREFENLFSAMNPMWGYTDFIEWDKVVDPANGYVKDNVLKFQAHVTANIPQGCNVNTNEDEPEGSEEWLALFEENLNEKIVGRICSEFIRMNTIIEKALTNDEISEKIISAAVDPVSAVIRSEIQDLEKKLEKFCANHISKVIRELKNMKESVASGSATNDFCDGKSDYESKGNDTNVKKGHNVEEETVPVSVLKIMKELIVEQQRTSFGGWLPSVYAGTRAAFYRTNEVHSFPDSIREADEFRLPKGPQALPYDSGTESFDGSHRQPEDIATNLETKQGTDQFSGAAQQQLRKNEKNKVEDVFESKGDEMSAKVLRPASVSDETTSGQCEQETLFLGKNANGQVEMHRVYHSKQLLDLKKKYSSYKIVGPDEF